MTSVGFWTASMSFAAVNVLPVPVAPSSTWWLKPALDAVDQLGDRRRLIAGRLVRGVDLQVGHGRTILAAVHRSHPSRSQRPISAPVGRPYDRWRCPSRTSLECPHPPMVNPLRRSLADRTVGDRPAPRRATARRWSSSPPSCCPMLLIVVGHRPVRAPVRRERHAHERGPRGGPGGDDHPVRRHLHAGDE